MIKDRRFLKAVDYASILHPGSNVRIEAILEAAESMGIRIHACRGSLSVGESPGGLPPDSCVQREGQITNVDLPMLIE